MKYEIDIRAILWNSTRGTYEVRAHVKFEVDTELATLIANAELAHRR